MCRRQVVDDATPTPLNLAGGEEFGDQVRDVVFARHACSPIIAVCVAIVPRR
jgi:hypothetical protein